MAAFGFGAGIVGLAAKRLVVAVRILGIWLFLGCAYRVPRNTRCDYKRSAWDTLHVDRHGMVE
jgi:hypothetical protein